MEPIHALASKINTYLFADEIEMQWGSPIPRPPPLLADEKFHKRTGELPPPLADDRAQTLF